MMSNLRDDLADMMWTISFKIWDLPGLADDRWVKVIIDDDFDVHPDTWIGRIADGIARWLYSTAGKISTHKHMPDEYADGILCFYDWDNDGIMWFDEVDIVPPPTFIKRILTYYGE